MHRRPRSARNVQREPRFRHRCLDRGRRLALTRTLAVCLDPRVSRARQRWMATDVPFDPRGAAPPSRSRGPNSRRRPDLVPVVRMAEFISNLLSSTLGTGVGACASADFPPDSSDVPARTPVGRGNTRLTLWSRRCNSCARHLLELRAPYMAPMRSRPSGSYGPLATASTERALWPRASDRLLTGRPECQAGCAWPCPTQPRQATPLLNHGLVLDW